MRFENTPRPDVPRPRGFRADPARPMALLARCPAYEPTPLRDLPGLAKSLGVGAVLVKDETARMRLGSFKALGGIYAVAQMVADAAGSDDPASDAARAVAATMTFITASAGNHGLSVAAGARIFGAKGVIVLGSGVPEDFAERIRAAGSEVLRVEGSYEDSVRVAMETAAQNGWLLLADGSWPGYTDRPALVMEGYTVLAEEIRAACAEAAMWPTHVFLQAGVGGLAAAVSAHIRTFWPVQPQIVVVEPNAAPCLLVSMKAGELRRGDGPESNMGRLDCKDASLIAFEALRDDADLFVTVSDAAADAATQSFAAHEIATTPSGAAPLAALQMMDLGPEARCLLIATEGPPAA